MHVGQPLLPGARDKAGGAARRGVARRKGLLHELRRGGDRVRDQARPPAALGRRPGRARGGVPRPDDGGPVGDAPGGEAGAVRAARARDSGWCRRTRPRWPRAVDETDRGRADRADPGGERHPPRRSGDPARCPRRLRRARRAARLRRDPVRHGPDGRHVGVAGRGRRARPDDGRQGAGWRPAGGRVRDDSEARRRAPAGRPRLHLRRGAGGRGRRERGAGRAERRRVPRVGRPRAARASARGSRRCRSRGSAAGG